MTVREFLYEYYNCDNMDTLKAKCCIDVNRLDLDAICSKEFKRVLDYMDRTEDTRIAGLILKLENDETKQE